MNNLETVGLDDCCEMTWSIPETLYGLSFTKELDLSGNGITEQMVKTLNNNLYSLDGNGQ